MAYLKYKEVYNLINSFKCISSKREIVVGTVMPSNITSLMTYKALFWLKIYNTNVLATKFK